jgi:hypothetical protein
VQTTLYFGPMEVARGVEELAEGAPALAVTIGFLDGVHREHSSVIGRTVEMASDGDCGRSPSRSTGTPYWPTSTVGSLTHGVLRPAPR